MVYTPSRAYRRLGLAEVLQLGIGVVAAEEAALLAIEGRRARDERHSLQPTLVRRMEHGVRQRDHGGAARRRRRAAAGLEGAEMLFKLQWRRRGDDDDDDVDDDGDGVVVAAVGLKLPADVRGDSGIPRMI